LRGEVTANHETKPVVLVEKAGQAIRQQRAVDSGRGRA